MAVDAALVKELRERTGAGIMDCKQALTQAEGDLEKAEGALRRRGVAKAAVKASRSTPEGLVSAYIHPGSRIGVLIEVNCETDFVARTQEFQDLVRDLALQIAGTNPPPRYLQREDIPADDLEKEKELFASEARSLGKPEKIVEQIIQGKVEKFYTAVCLLEQPYLKDPEIRVRDLISQKVAKMGENIRIHRFTRYQLGE